MVKLVFCARRLPHLSRAEFQRYWREVHGPLVARHAGLLRIKRYVQVHTLDDPLGEALQASRGTAEAFDGVAELWWERRDDLLAATGSADGRQAAEELLEDERRFIDLPRSVLFVAQEHVVVAG